MKRLSITIIFFFFGPMGCDLPGVKKVPSVEELTEDTSPNDDDSSFSGKDGKTPDTNKQPEPVNLPGNLAEDLLGTWVGPCVDDTKILFQFSTNQWVKAIVNFPTSSNCSGDYLALSGFGGTYTIDSIEDDGLINWDLNLSNFQRTFYTQELVDYVNSVKFYGYTDWKIGEAKECISRPNLNGDVVAPQKIYATMAFSQSGELAFGIWSGTPEERDTTVDWSGQDGGPFKRVQ